MIEQTSATVDLRLGFACVARGAARASSEGARPFELRSRMQSHASRSYRRVRERIPIESSRAHLLGTEVKQNGRKGVAKLRRLRYVEILVRLGIYQKEGSR